MNNDIRERAASILSLALGMDVDANSNINFKQSEIWDSVKYIELVFMLEDEFGMHLSTEQLASINCLDDIVNVITEINKLQK